MKRSVLAILSVLVIGVASPNAGMSQEAQQDSEAILGWIAGKMNDGWLNKEEGSKFFYPRGFYENDDTEDPRFAETYEFRDAIVSGKCAIDYEWEWSDCPVTCSPVIKDFTFDFSKWSVPLRLEPKEGFTKNDGDGVRTVYDFTVGLNTILDQNNSHIMQVHPRNSAERMLNAVTAIVEICSDKEKELF